MYFLRSCKHKVVLNKNQSTLCVHDYEIQLMLCREIIAVYFRIRRKPINTVYDKNKYRLKVTASGKNKELLCFEYKQ
jgi:hypothetical protein